MPVPQGNEGGGNPPGALLVNARSAGVWHGAGGQPDSRQNPGVSAPLRARRGLSRMGLKASVL